MTIADLAVVAVVIVPIVLLLSFAGCGIDAVGTQQEIPLPERRPPKDEDEVREPPDIFGPPPDTVPVVTPDPNRYHGLVLNGTTEVIAYWKLDDTAVNGLAANSGPAAKNSGIYRKGVTAADGVLRLGPWPLDGATQFDGTGWVNVAYDMVMNPASATNFSLEAWILPSIPVAGRGVIAGSYRVGAGAGQIDRGFVLELIGGGAAPRVRARTAPDGNAEAALSGGVSGWHHVVLVYEAVAKRLTLYLNGAQAAVDTAASYVANRQTGPTDTATPLRIGAGQVEPFNPASPEGMFFTGRIDQVALYRGALSATAVADHFAAATTP